LIKFLEQLQILGIPGTTEGSVDVIVGKPDNIRPIVGAAKLPSA
jgi:hypothetical protein